MDSLKIVTDHFVLEQIPSLPLVFGEKDFYLKLIEDAFQVEILFRGSEFNLKTKNQTSLEEAKKIINKLYNQALTHKKHPSASEVKQWIAQLKIESSLDSNLLQQLPIGSKKILRFKNQRQQQYVHNVLNSTVSFGVGSAGTGKTYLAVACALHELLEGNIQKIILTRPVVEAGESLGFLPGTLEDKIAPYLKPLMDSMESVLKTEELISLMDKRKVEIIPLAYMRGRSLNNAFIILDEAQNTSASQIKMFLTRLGHYSKAIITGDLSQKDIPSPKTGLDVALEILSPLEEVSINYFEKHHTVRHPLVEKVIGAFEQYEEAYSK